MSHRCVARRTFTSSAGRRSRRGSSESADASPELFCGIEMTEPREMDLKAWIGRSETLSDIATAAPVAALCATLDRPPIRPSAGTPLPPLWHWLYFLPLHRQSDIGPDGHAK